MTGIDTVDSDDRVEVDLPDADTRQSEYPREADADLDEAPVDAIEAARSAYESGEISLLEYERRAEFLVDDRNERICAVVEEVNGIGDARSWAIARKFESVDTVATASREELMEVHGIGEQRADAIHKYLGG